MALISCPECGGKVSDQALACPHCGISINSMLNVSVNTGKTKRKIAIGIVIGAALLLCISGAIVIFQIYKNSIEAMRIADAQIARAEQMEIEKNAVGEDEDERLESNNSITVTTTRAAAKPAETLVAKTNAPTSIDEYASLEYYCSLVLDGEPVVSISQNRKYALTQTYDDYGLTIYIYRNDNEAYAFYKSVYIEFTDGRADNHTLRLCDDGSIAWSNNGEYFAFCCPRALIYVVNSDIYVCDVKMGNVTNLTGTSEERDFDIGGTVFIDFLPAWSLDDSLIYFSRFGKEDGNNISGLYSVSAGSGTVKLEKNMIDDDNIYVIYRALINNENTFYYNADNANLLLAGITKLEGNSETMFIIKAEINGEIVDISPRVRLKDVSSKGDRILCYLDADFYSLPYEQKFFFIDTKFPYKTIELSPISSQESVVHNVVLSPDGRFFLQIESDSDAGWIYFYLVDAESYENKLIISEVVEEPFSFGMTSNPNNYNQLQPKWLNNNYIAINGYAPALLKLLTKNEINTYSAATGAATTAAAATTRAAAATTRAAAAQTTAAYAATTAAGYGYPAATTAEITTAATQAATTTAATTAEATTATTTAPALTTPATTMTAGEIESEIANIDN